ncbi:MAG: nitroreductase [Ruminococcus sp.]|jgi:nitroreductase|nr:nitroreductase [Ruminococcus sp.]
MMDDLTAINLRHSRRAYTSEPISLDLACKLHDFTEEINKEAGINFRLITNNGDAFNGILKTYGVFTGVRNYFVMVTKKDNRQNQIASGYYGEKIVLFCTKLGLNTCWVGGCFDRKSCPVDLAEDEEILCAITVGYSPKKTTIQENLLKIIITSKSKKPEELYESESGSNVPEWFMSGIAAVVHAPSTYNRQPVKFVYRRDGTVSALITQEDKTSGVDLGVAKLHFELGSGKRFA